MRSSIILSIILCLSPGCASYHYSDVQTGQLHGKLTVQWIDYDQFLFIPHAEDPLTFVRYNNESITPGKMYTDGGSIPRPFWALRNYSPWGYAPAYIVHDWLFEMGQCKLPGHENYDVEKAGLIMSEVIKTLMENPDYGAKNKLVLYSIYKAVVSPIAHYVWNEVECDQPTAAYLFSTKKKPLFQYVIEYP